MEPRKKITEIVRATIPGSHERKPTFNDICRTNTVFATDIIVGIENIRGWDEPGFGAMDNDPVYYNYWVLVIEKTREENDDEYSKRMESLESWKKKTDEREWNDYLRLKAKFETENKSYGRTVALDIIEVKPLPTPNSPVFENFVICKCKEPKAVLNGMGEWICEKCAKRIIEK